MPFTVRRPVREMAAYVSGESARDMIQLGLNESAFPPSPRAIEAARQACRETRRYNDENYTALKRALADHHGLDEDRIICGAGSMDIMRDLAGCCLEPGRTLVTGRLSYAFPAVLARAAGADVRLVEDSCFTHDIDAFIDAVTDCCAIVYIASPNNPTGTSAGLEAVRRIAEALPDHVLLMIDAAYGDYVTTPVCAVSGCPGRRRVQCCRSSHVLQGPRPGRPANRLGLCRASGHRGGGKGPCAGHSLQTGHGGGHRVACRHRPHNPCRAADTCPQGADGGAAR